MTTLNYDYRSIPASYANNGCGEVNQVKNQLKNQLKSFDAKYPANRPPLDRSTGLKQAHKYNSRLYSKYQEHMIENQILQTRNKALHEQSKFLVEENSRLKCVFIPMLHNVERQHENEWKRYLNKCKNANERLKTKKRKLRGKNYDLCRRIVGLKNGVSAVNMAINGMQYKHR